MIRFFDDKGPEKPAKYYYLCTSLTTCMFPCRFSADRVLNLADEEKPRIILN
jgi:hypothetical protein